MASTPSHIFVLTLFHAYNQILEGFKTASANQIYELANQWRETPSRAILSPDALLQVFLHNLSIDRVPSVVVEQDDDDASQRAYAAFSGLRGFRELFPTHPIFRDQILAAWPGIFEWSLYLCKQRLQTPDPRAQDVDNTTKIVCGAFHDFLGDPTLRSRMEKTTGIFELCARFWMHPETAVVISSAVLQLMAINASWDNLNEIGQAAKDTIRPVEIPELAVKRLRVEIAKDPLEPSPLDLYINVVGVLMRLPGHYFTHVCLEKRVISLVTKTLLKISKIMRRSATEGRRFEKVVAVGFNFLRFALVRSTGFPYIKEALQAGLLQAMCGCAPAFSGLDDLPRECIRHIIRDTLTRGLVIGSVVKVMKKMLESIDEKDQDNDIRRSFVGEDWNTLVSLARIRGVLLEATPKERKTVVPCGWEGVS